MSTGCAAQSLAYQYVLLRAVPRVERGERVNVGVLVYCQAAGLLRCAWRIEKSRLLALAADVDLQGLSAALQTVDRICAGIDATSRAATGGPAAQPLGARFGWLAAPRSTILQPGPIHAGVTADPGGEADRLMARFVDRIG